MSSDHLRLGNEAYEHGDYVFAEKCYRNALQDEPTMSHLWVNLSNAQAGQGKLDDAILSIKEARRCNHVDMSHWVRLAELLFEADREREALEAYLEVLATNQRSIAAYVGAARCLRILKRSADAIELLERGLQQYPNSASLAKQIAVTYKGAGESRRAWEWLDKALEFDPGDAYIHWELAAILWQLGLDQPSMEHYAEALRLAPDMESAKEEYETRKAILANESGSSRFRGDEETSQDWRKGFQEDISKRLNSYLGDLIGSDKIQIYNRNPVSECDHTGYLLEFGHNLALIENLDENMLIPNGYTVIRLQDIHAVQISTYFASEAVQKLGYRKPQEMIVDISSWHSLLTSLNADSRLILVEQGRKDPGCVFVGKILEIREGSFILRNVDTKGKWDDDEELFYQDITYIEFSSGYLKGLEAVVDFEVAH